MSDRDLRQLDGEGTHVEPALHVVTGSGEPVDLVDRLKDAGFLTSNAGAHRNVIKIRPPMVFSASDSDLLLGALADVLETVTGEIVDETDRVVDMRVAARTSSQIPPPPTAET